MSQDKTTFELLNNEDTAQELAQVSEQEQEQEQKPQQEQAVAKDDESSAPRSRRAEESKKRVKRNRFIALICVFAALELASCLIPFNVIDTALPLSLALIPIIIAGIICGPLMGSLIGFIGGIFNMIVWSTPLAVKPDVAFVYSPFASGGGFASLVISVLPLALAGLVAAVVHMGILAAQNRKKAKATDEGCAKQDKWYAPATYAVSAAVASIVYILLVLAGISMFSIDVLAGIFILKGVVEALIACVFAIAACYPILKIKGLNAKRAEKKQRKSKKNKSENDGE